MTDLESIELILRRALTTEVEKRVQDLSTINTLELVLREFERVHKERVRR